MSAGQAFLIVPRLVCDMPAWRQTVCAPGLFTLMPISLEREGSRSQSAASLHRTRPPSGPNQRSRATRSLKTSWEKSDFTRSIRPPAASFTIEGFRTSQRRKPGVAQALTEPRRWLARLRNAPRFQSRLGASRVTCAKSCPTPRKRRSMSSDSTSADLRRSERCDL